MTPLAIFLVPGEFALETLLLFLELPANAIEPELAKVFSFLLALLFWSKLYSICVAIIKRQFGFGQQGRH